MATTPPVPNRSTESETANIKLSCEDWEMHLQVSVADRTHDAE
jgi:hypothetical protein